MKLFDAVPSDLFGILASPNRIIYAEALRVLHDAFLESLTIPRKHFQELLKNNLSSLLAQTTFDEEGIEENERANIAGRASFLVRKLLEKGWIGIERAADYSENIIIYDYSIKLIELFATLTEDKPLKGLSYVYSTYSALHTASTDPRADAATRVAALEGAVENTEQLIRMLKTVYHNINGYFDQQLKCTDTNKVLALHFDNFAERVVETRIKPLKIRDSVPKYRVSITNVLDEWIENVQLFDEMVAVLIKSKTASTTSEARADVFRSLYFIKDTYATIEETYLDPIDQKIQHYTRATTQKLEALTNRDDNLQGNLRYLLRQLASAQGEDLAERTQEIFSLTEQGCLSSDSLFFRRDASPRPSDSLVVLTDYELADAEIAQAQALLDDAYSPTHVFDQVRKMLHDRRRISLEEFPVESDEHYVVALLALVYATDPLCFYRLESISPELFTRGIYQLPHTVLALKEESQL
ncbi:MAG: DUF5716 family protein [Gordonibacter sp.]|uniref:Wadjet anti-phage system protein JetA family protein n=1 Tax=Gordonibacter sp. TaxID=1968902 RepID=UPI002FC9E3C1